MDLIENLIIGTGPAGLATAMALKARGQSFEVIDVGYDLETSTASHVADLKTRDPSTWSDEEKSVLFPPPVTSHRGVEKRFYFGSDFPYRKPTSLATDIENAQVDLSHAQGGFGNVWGAAMLPYNKTQIERWPIAHRDLEAAYQRVLDYVPFSAEDDALAEQFPLYTTNYSTLPRNKQSNFFLNTSAKKTDRLKSAGVHIGRARVAVDSSGGENSCRHCGKCLDGCAYDSIFNPRTLWKSLCKEYRLHDNHYAFSIEEQDGFAEVKTTDLATNTQKAFSAKRVYLGAGQFATTKILANALNLFNTPIKIQDSQYFFFPFLSYRGNASKGDFTLAEAFIELENSAASADPVHVQVYGKNQLFVDTLNQQLPFFVPKQPIIDRLFLMQGFLSSKDSAHMTMQVDKPSAAQQHIRIRGVENPQTKSAARHTRWTVQKHLFNLGIAPPIPLQILPAGRSFHAGGSFPMGATDEIFRSDKQGRPAHFKRVHIVDSACFSDIPGSTIAISIMANADRIVHETTCS